CHVEMTEDMIRSWLRGGADEIKKSAASAGVQTPSEIERRIEQRVEALHKVADRVYDKWTEGLAKG
ncbi:MAG: hypothetical protein Q8M03_07790, partial [Legionella sp.]|nr:hypothetical protein [Legionella sp.]